MADTCLGARSRPFHKKATSRTPDGKMPGESRCSPREIQNYLNRISGSLLDRIDIHVEVPAVKFREITAERTGETSAQIRERVVAARRRQQERFAGKRSVTCNARMGTKELKAFFVICVHAAASAIVMLHSTRQIGDMAVPYLTN